MVIIDYPFGFPYPNYPYPSPTYPSYPMVDEKWPEFLEKKEKKIRERHVKEVKKGIMIKFEDGSWEFIATDDDCFQKIKKAVES